ncbi:hypothetical protein ACKWTF_008182 [Chironomus riparius]
MANVDQKRLIKFFTIPTRRSIKDLVSSICRKLQFTSSGYKDINGLFIEKLVNNRYHLHMYTRNEEIHHKLRELAKKTSDENYLSLELNRINHLFTLPPFNNVTYKVDQMNRDHELFEKVLEFKTGSRQTIMDVMLAVDIQRHRINYIVCNREKTYICFCEGTDAIEVQNKLRIDGVIATYSNCYAHIEYLEGDVDMVPVQREVRNNPVRNNPIRNNPVRYNQVRNNPVRNNPIRNNPIRHNPIRYNQVRNNPVRYNQVRNNPVRNNIARNIQRRINFNNDQNNSYIRGNFCHANNFNRAYNRGYNNNNNRTKIIKVEVPSYVNQQQFEIRLVNK